MNLNSILRAYDALGLPKFPITVNLEPTNACQLRCKTCYRQGRPVGGHIKGMKQPAGPLCETCYIWKL